MLYGTLGLVLLEPHRPDQYYLYCTLVLQLVSLNGPHDLKGADQGFDSLV